MTNKWICNDCWNDIARQLGNAYLTGEMPLRWDEHMDRLYADEDFSEIEEAEEEWAREIEEWQREVEKSRIRRWRFERNLYVAKLTRKRKRMNKEWKKIKRTMDCRMNK